MSTPESKLPPLSPDVVELLEAERQSTGPPTGVRERMFTHISSTLGLPGGGGLGPSPGENGGAAGSPPITESTGGLAGASGTAVGGGTAINSGITQLVISLAKPVTLIAFGVGVATGMGTHALLHASKESPVTVPSHHTETPSVSVEQPMPEIQVTEPKLAEPETPTQDFSGPYKPRKKTIERKRPSSTPTLRQKRAAALAAERNLIEIARTALVRSRADDAIRALQQHGRKYPNGQLIEEREALFILALVTQGNHEDAKVRALRFRRRYHNSLLLPAIDGALQKATK